MLPHLPGASSRRFNRADRSTRIMPLLAAVFVVYEEGIESLVISF